MSHANGHVIHDGRIVGHFEYNGTVDVAKRDIHATDEELHLQWRQECRNNCTCGKPPADVLLWASYGYGFHWPAKACLECRCIVEGLDPWHKEYKPEGWGFASGYDVVGPDHGHPLYETEGAEGGHARKHGAALDACPYAAGSDRRFHWEMGWREAGRNEELNNLLQPPDVQTPHPHQDGNR